MERAVKATESKELATLKQVPRLAFQHIYVTHLGRAAVTTIRSDARAPSQLLYVPTEELEAVNQAA